MELFNSKMIHLYVENANSFSIKLLQLVKIINLIKYLNGLEKKYAKNLWT